MPVIRRSWVRTPHEMTHFYIGLVPQNPYFLFISCTCPVLRGRDPKPVFISFSQLLFWSRFQSRLPNFYFPGYPFFPASIWCTGLLYLGCRVFWCCEIGAVPGFRAGSGAHSPQMAGPSAPQPANQTELLLSTPAALHSITNILYDALMESLQSSTLSMTIAGGLADCADYCYLHPARV